MIPKGLSSDLIRGREPVSRLREAVLAVGTLALRFGGRSRVEQGHAQTGVMQWH
jgi:hypothetical protein